MTQPDMPPALLAQIHEAAAAIRDGGDIAPALRFGIEGQLVALLQDRAQLEPALRAVLGESLPSAELVVDGSGARLNIWQARAPVVPSTKG